MSGSTVRLEEAQHPDSMAVHLVPCLSLFSILLSSIDNTIDVNDRQYDTTHGKWCTDGRGVRTDDVALEASIHGAEWIPTSVSLGG
eukprot:6059564-Pyramimonas_sp.AAC.2